MTTKTDDQTTLYSIVNDLDANLMIEAGAGTGKTYALVSRVVALVKAGVRMQHIVAITFTEAAAAELSERIRSRMEQLLDDQHPDNVHDLLARELSDQARDRISRAVAELDQASVQTIHSFAAQLLRDRPLSAIYRRAGRQWTQWYRPSVLRSSGTNGWTARWAKALTPISSDRRATVPYRR